MTTRPTLTIDQFAHVLQAVGTEMVLIGGQGVALWAAEYRDALKLPGPVTSKDIDFWGERQTVIALARKLGTRAHLPGMRDFTALSGIVRVHIGGSLVSIDVLRKVPGVDETSWDKATAIVNFQSGSVRVLDPISLIASKLHNLRHFDQTGRNDADQLKLCVRIAAIFVEQAFVRNVRLGLFYVKRLIRIMQLPGNDSTIRAHSVRLADVIPIGTIQRLHADATLPEEHRQRLENFLRKQWPRLISEGAGE